MWTDLNLTEFHSIMLLFISWHNPSRAVQGEGCLKEQKKNLNTQCPLSAIIIFEWMNLWKIMNTPFNFYIWWFLMYHFYYHLSFVTGLDKTSLAWNLPLLLMVFCTGESKVHHFYFVLPPHCCLTKEKPLLPSCHVVLTSIMDFLISASLPIDILLLKVHNTLLLLVPVCGCKTSPINEELYLATFSGDVMCSL